MTSENQSANSLLTSAVSVNSASINRVAVRNLFMLPGILT